MQLPGDTGRKTMKPQTYESIKHRRALELEAMPTLARAVFESSENAKKTGERVREAIDGLLVESNEAAAGCQGGDRSAAPQTLTEALDVIRAMHSDLTAFRCPDFYQFLNEDKIGEFDGRVKAVLAHSAPVIKADRAAPLPEASPATKGQCNDERACGACFSGQSACETAAPAPQVTPAVVEAVIGSEHYFTADQGERQEIEDYLRDHPGEYPPFIPDPLHMITICTLVTKNGHSVVGVAYCADPARFNAQTGRDAARADAIRQLWPMVIYAERERLAAPPSIQLTPAEVQSGLDRVRWAEGLIKQLPENHDGRNSWLLNYGTDKAERQAEWARRNPQSSLAKNIAAAPDLRPAADAQGQ